jgi:hypothetical protein
MDRQANPTFAEPSVWDESRRVWEYPGALDGMHLDPLGEEFSTAEQVLAALDLNDESWHGQLLRIQIVDACGEVLDQCETVVGPEHGWTRKRNQTEPN